MCKKLWSLITPLLETTSPRSNAMNAESASSHRVSRSRHLCIKAACIQAKTVVIANNPLQDQWMTGEVTEELSAVVKNGLLTKAAHLSWNLKLKTYSCNTNNQLKLIHRFIVLIDSSKWLIDWLYINEQIKKYNTKNNFKKLKIIILRCVHMRSLIHYIIDIYIYIYMMICKYIFI